jgi:hypothetical protein
MTVQETFSEWFRQLDQRDQNTLLAHVKDRYFSTPSPLPKVESANTATENYFAEPEKRQAVCPTCKREL